MSSEPRGSDFNSWWRNRAAYRQSTSQTVAQLRDTQSRAARAAGNARASESVGFADAPPETVMQRANATLSTLSAAEAGLPKLKATLKSEESAYINVTANVQSSAEQRTRAEAEMAARGKIQSQRRWLEKRQKLKKLSAVVIFLLILFVLFQY